MKTSIESLALKKASTNFINILYKNGYFEILMFLLVEQSIMYTGVFISLCNMFISGNMDYVCNVPENFTEIKGILNKCVMLNTTSNITEKCFFGYKFISDKDFIQSSIKAEFELICDYEYYDGAAQSCIMGGFFVGGIVGPLIGDKYGRRFVTFIGFFLAGVLGILLGFITNIYLFIIGNFFLGILREVIISVGFVYGLEFIPNHKQSLFGMLTQLLWSLNLVFLCFMAYFLRNWRYLQICGSMFTFFNGFLVFIVPESPRWLIAKGRFLELELFVNNFANKFNKIKLKSSEMLSFKIISGKLEEKSFSKYFKTEYSPFDIIRSKLLCKWMSILILGWVFVVISYYCSTMLSIKIPGNKYVAFISTSIIEVPSILLAFFLLRGGRNIIFLCLNIICGICNIAVGFLRKDFAITILLLSIVGKGTLSAIFYIIVVTSLYIFPTTIRSFGMAFPSSISKLIAISIPYFVKLQNVYGWLPTLIIGSSACFIGVINIMFPDWINQPLPETLDDLEDLRMSCGLCHNSVMSKD